MWITFRGILHLKEDKHINEIRQTIARAKAHEQSTSLLASRFDQNLTQLHDAIDIPNTNKVATLMNFVIHYVEHVPDFIEAVSNITNDAGIYKSSDQIISIAKDYFINPPSSVSEHKHSGLIGLMDEAYLAHRFMEEINDRFIGQLGIPLAPMDMTRSNIIIHHLIGEPFANELDEAVRCSVESLMAEGGGAFKSEAFLSYAKEHKNRGWSKELEQWPCLATDLSITLRFEKGLEGDNGPDETLH